MAPSGHEPWSVAWGDACAAWPRLDVLADVDVCVAGAGPAGLGAALAVARSGGRVCLLERHGFLGGNFTAASVGTICGLYVADGAGWDFVTHGIAQEVATALAAQGPRPGRCRSSRARCCSTCPGPRSACSTTLVSAEPGITLFLHSFVADAVVDEDRLDAVVVATKRGPMAVRARAFVDATGDADLVFHAGAPWAIGDAGQRQFASMQFFMQHADTAALLAGGPRR